MIIISKEKSKKESSKKHDSKKESKDSKISHEELHLQLKEKTDLMIRLQAEFANFKRRTEEERLRIYNEAVGDVLKSFVNVFDDFELALKNDSNPEEFKKGVELIFAKFISTSEEFGLKKIPTEGKEFDPRLHEALLAEESDGPEQMILEELQAGYQVKDSVIRTAKVKVSK